MARLPVVGGDNETWGSILNEYLSVSHDPNGMLKPGTVSNGTIASDAAIDQSKVAGLIPDLSAKADTDLLASVAMSGSYDDLTGTPDLSNYLQRKNNVITLTDSALDRFARVDIPDDGTAKATWADRLAFYFNGTRTGYFNEYGELRARPGSSSTIALRAQKWAGPSSVDIFQVTSSDNLTLYFNVGPNGMGASVPLQSTAAITTTASVSAATVTASTSITAPNIGNKVTASATAPSNPAVGDVWIDTSA